MHSIQRTTFFLLAALAVSACGERSSDPQPMACADLASLGLADATITLAEPVAAGGFEAPPDPMSGASPDLSGLPAFCRVAAIVTPTEDSEIEFELWLPEADWNGGFVGIGDGGFIGAILHGWMAGPLMDGYAVANTDGGHKGSAADATFAVGHPEKMIDHAWRGVHLMTVLSKEIVAARYGRPPERSLFTGCSTGGRQGLKAAQRFPDDYDAIASMAPANNWVPLMSFALLIQQQFDNPDAALDPAKLPLIKEAAIAACDMNDSVADRVIDDPQACDFDPGVLACEDGESANCLLPHEVESARTIYAGVIHPQTGEVLFPGAEPSSELEWGAFRRGVFPIGENYMRDIVFPEREWDLMAFDFGADIDEAIKREYADLAAVDPDLSPFFASGGKLLFYHGWIDGLITPQNSIDYYESVVTTLGEDAVAESMRFYLLPGVAHCSAMEGTGDFAVRGTLEEWLATGTPPERIVARKTLEDGSERTRPLCPYPQVARYSGSGSTNEADSFECVAP